MADQERSDQVDGSNVKEALDMRYSVLHYLMKNRIMVNLSALLIIWVASSFNFYMCNLQIKYIPGNF